jgi:hypothetical protein
MTLDPQTAIVTGFGLLIGSYLLFRISRARAQTPPRDPRRMIQELREREEIQGDLQKLVVDIQELTRQNIAVLDTKMKILQQLIADADARIKALGPTAANAGAGAEPPLRQKVFEMADRGLDAHQIGRQLGMERGEVDLILGLRQVKS